MLKLYLLRHGKATKQTDEKSDFTRHLNKEGVAQINQVGYILREKAIKIDQIIASGATRTTETAEIANHFLGLPKIQFDDGFYLATYNQVLALLGKYAKSNNILYVGHNNGISDLAAYLTGKNIVLSTGHLVEIQFDTESWGLVSQRTGTLVSQVVPDVHTF